MSATLLANGQMLEVRHSDLGIDLDKNTYYDVLLPKSFQSNQAFVIKMKTGVPKGKAEKLMDAKM
ncbi:hypothetical protein [Sphingobacterium sp. IITKGP-BTPF85]|uniref:hypothetical protein n=1 Tax=Sphingobacterium sp. IITKGP-BTPF85 TaxID=1338009 RepID=UPI0004095E50|nr:hypothetical protein [Sphingobacterium sp. IITKGP-BTPF85]